MNLIKAGCAGLFGALFIFVVVFIGVHVTGMAPFNLSPSSAFLMAIGIAPKPLGIVAHFAYGFVWAAFVYVLFGARTTIGKAMGVAFVQWLVMMVVFTPITGWGLFGFGGVGHGLAADAPLHLGNPIKYLILTFVLHMIYGAINGALIPRFVRSRSGYASP